MISMSKAIPNYLSVFEKKLESLKNKIDREIKKPKKERSKVALKGFLDDAKRLKETIKTIKNDHARLCPHCGKEV
jgi:hypothetical protein